MNSHGLRLSHGRGRWITSLVLAALCASAPALAADWVVVVDEDGVVVDQKEVRGRDLPIFRGRILIRGSLYDVITVLDDTARRVEWVHRCIESRLVKKESDFKRFIYNRTEAPWPVNDRDVLVLTEVTVDPVKRVVRIEFEEKTGVVPEVDGVVRIPLLKGLYLLKAVGENHTRVTYQIDSDPGGWLPNWLIKRASRKIPLKTLLGLQKQVDKVRRHGGSEAVRARWHARLVRETGQVVPEAIGPPAPPTAPPTTPPTAPPTTPPTVSPTP